MQTYLVGGAVRDALMGRPTHDRDYVVVGATPSDMEALGYKNVGESFPVFMDKNGDQYALARKERKIGMGYNGFSVEFDKSITLEDDLYRRDLTINAIAQDLVTGEIIDPHGGQKDLAQKVLRHVSDAFAEDPLRVVRLARFYSRYTDFSIASSTVSIAQKVVLSGELDAISHERYWAEIYKVMQDTHADPQRFFEALQLFGIINCVSFFCKNFKKLPTAWHVSINIGPRAAIAKKMFSDVNMAFMAMIVSCANSDADLSKVSSDIQDTHLAWNRMWEIIYAKGETLDAIHLFHVLAFCRATSKMSLKISNIIAVLEMMEHLDGVRDTVTSCILREAAIASQSVTSAAFIEAGLRDTQLGEAMNRERLSRIEKVLHSKRILCNDRE